MAIYTFQCFSVFRYENEHERNGIYIRQNIAMMMIFLLSFLVLYMNIEENERLPAFYIAGQITTLAVILFYRLVYRGANRLIVNNMCMLLSISFIMLARLSSDKAVKQLLIAVFSLVFTAIIPLILMKFSNLRRFYYLFAGLGIGLLLFVLIFSTAVYGSKLNLTIAGVSFQPSEYVKLTFVFAIAGLLAKSQEIKDIAITALIAGAHILILVLSRDLGSALIFFTVYIVLLFIATDQLRYLVIGLLSGIVSSVVGYRAFSHVRVRVAGFLDPVGTIDSAGFQIAQALFALGTGGFFGLGLCQGAPGRIPVVYSDLIFAAICEELGVLFGICVVLICVSIFVMFMNIAMKFSDLFYKLVAVGLSVTYGFQVFLNLGGVTKFIPLTGVTLPLVSYGGNSILVTLLMFSMIQGLYNAVWQR